MRFDRWKRWQWAVVGILLGAATGWLWSGPPAFEAGAGRESWTDIEARQFRRDLRRVVRDEPFVSNLVVYPRDAILGGKPSDPVTFDWRDPYRPKEPTKHYFYYTPVPFPGLGDETYPDVRAFLDKVAGKGRYDHVAYRYAWWCVPSTAVGMGAVAGLVLVCGIWPTLLRLAARAAGLPVEAPAPKSTVGLGGTGPEVVATGPPRDVAAEDEAMEAVMARYASAGTITDGGSVDEEPDEEEAADRPLRTLETAPLDDSTAGAPAKKNERKVYGGAYYPVARTQAEKDADEK